MKRSNHIRIRPAFAALAFGGVLAIAWLLPLPATPAAAQGPNPINGVAVSAAQAADVNFAELAREQASRAPGGAPLGKVIPFHAQVEPANSQAPSTAPLIGAAPSQVEAASVGPTLNYVGLDDIAGGGFHYIPPDTMGAVGITRTLDTLNNDYRVQTKSNGAIVSTVSMSSFWASTGGSGFFDPSTLYDPYNNRFIVVAVSDSASSSSSIEVGLSTTSDPNGSYTLFRFPACSVSDPCGAGTTDWWADFPAVGFNKNWVAVSVNMFSTASGSFMESRVLAVNYPNLLGGSFSATYFTGINDFAIRPCVTYSKSENTLYAPNHRSSAGATYRLNTLTGTPASPSYNVGTSKSHTLAPLSGGWAVPQDNSLPQAPGSGGAGDVAMIDAGDARILRCTFRNSNIWYSQTVYLPKISSTHTAAQWVRLDASGNDVDGGRVEDAEATATNGGKWYAYPTLTVNQFTEVLMGFSQFSSSQWPAAGYTFRGNADAAGTMRDPHIYKGGEGMYWKTFASPCSSGSNRWGDYSVTQVDPVDDTSMWTLQEYSKPEGSPFAATGCNSGVWSTWWAQVTPLHYFFPLILK
jgi:hypothetical protein